MECKELGKKLEIKISTQEMNEIMLCVGEVYEHRIHELQHELELYKRQISNLIKDCDKK